MQLIIGNPIVKNNPKHKYKITLTYMHGDGDSYNDKEYLFSGDHIEPFKLEDLIRMVCLYRDHDCSEDLNKLKKYGASDDEINHLGKYLVGDLTTGDTLCAYIESFSVVYFDKNGIEHSVEIVP